MPIIIGSYSLKNLLQSLEYLSNLTKNLSKEIEELKTAKEEVIQKQKEAQKQGFLVKKMTNYMSEELERIERSEKFQDSNKNISQNLENFSTTESKLKDLRNRLNDFINSDDVESLEASDRTLSIELQQYESFLLELNNLLMGKIATFEKIVNRMRGEKRESQQQKLLLSEMVDLFNDEIDDLEKTMNNLK